jgi:hypothetical protein
MKKNLFAAALCGLSMLVSGAASAVVVGGVDFGNILVGSHIETSTLAETLINGNGQNLMGYGQVNTVNGTQNYAAGGQNLYFTFKNYISTGFTGAATGFTGGLINIYLGTLPNLLSQNSATNMAQIATLTPFAQLVGHGINGTTSTLNANGTLTGAAVNFLGTGLLDATAGFGSADVYNFFNSNTIADGGNGFADVSLTSSGNNIVLNPNDVCTGQAGQFCIAGTANLRGTTVPEPDVLALIGLGLLGMGASLRKRKSA